MFKVKELKPDRMRHFGLMVRDEVQLSEVRQKLTTKIWDRANPRVSLRFRDPFGNHIQVVDLHDESLVWCCPTLRFRKRVLLSGLRRKSEGTASARGLAHFRVPARNEHPFQSAPKGWAHGLSRFSWPLPQAPGHSHDLRCCGSDRP